MKGMSVILGGVNSGLRVSAVSYLNTWPLVWGFLHGPLQGRFQFRFDLPAVCAATLGSGEVELGLVPSATLTPLGLDFLPDLGIAAEGPVRSILLVSKVPVRKIQTLAADSSSRTSVALTRILLRERYGCEPSMTRHAPDLEAMLRESDAALIIGDPALRLDPATLPYEVLDLGAEWTTWSGLPMVFAVWAGQTPVLTPEVRAAFLGSYQWGKPHLESMVARAGEERGFEPALARDYLTKIIQYELTPRHLEGLALFRKLASQLA